MNVNEIFKEWTEYASQKKLLERDISLPLKLAERKILSLSGVRRAGKSSLMMLLFQKERGNKAYINLEDSRFEEMPNLLDNVVEWFGDEGTLYLDEISSAPDWQGWLARTHELTKGKLKLICSSSRATLFRPGKPLRGRIIRTELFPLSFPEFLKFNKIKQTAGSAGRGKLKQALEMYLFYGGFPEVVLSEGILDKTTILQEYFKDIVALDMGEISGEKVELIEVFSYHLLKSTYFSATRFVNTMKSAGHGVGKTTMLSLEKCSEEAYLFFFVPILSFNIADKLQYPRKVYPVDTGFANAVTGIKNYGRMYENAVFLKLRRGKNKQAISEINYWKSKEGYEVDFVVREGMKVKKLLQVAYELGEETKQREVRALTKAAEEFGLSGKHGELTVITKDYEAVEKINNCKIRFVPLLAWLLD